MNARHAIASCAPALSVRVVGPNDGPPPGARQLLPDASDGRSLGACSWLLVTEAERVLACAAYSLGEGVLKVPAVAVAALDAAAQQRTLTALFDVVEAGCLAGGASRVLVDAGAPAITAVLRARGYAAMWAGAMRTWQEKRL